MTKPFYRVETFEGRKSVGYLIRLLYGLALPRAEALFADAELTFSQWVTLIALRDGIANTCSDISRHLNHDSGAITRLVDQMERRGLVARSRSKRDRRVIDLALTPKGKAMAKALAPRIVNFWNVILEDFSTDEAHKLVNLLTRLARRLEAEPVSVPVVPKKKKAIR